MRPVTMLMLAVVFALPGSAALAADNCDVCAPSVAVCPPVAVACPAECPPIPAAVGAGPVPSLCNLACPTDFDKAFIQSMYQHHQDIIGLATLGIQQSTDSELRGLSAKIRQERTDMNVKLVKWGRVIGECDLNLVCNTCITDQLSTLVGDDFNIRYAVLMTGLLQQSADAAQMGMSQSGIADLRNQSRIEFRASQNEIAALKSWLVRHGIANTPGVPCGAGPVCATIPPPSPCPAPCPVTCPAPCPAPCPTVAPPCPPAAGPVCPDPCPAPVGTAPDICPTPCP